MLVAFDIGNTNIKTGVFDKGVLKHSWRLSSNRTRTADELGIIIRSFFDHLNLSFDCIEGIIISSVIPSMNYTIEHMCALYFNQTPLFVHAGMNTGLSILYDTPQDLGADRICTAVAAYHFYQSACVTIDFGTATSFGVVSSVGEFIGGVICPGLKVSSDALVENTSQLAKIELIHPSTVIGTSTISGMQSGIVFGYVGQIDYLIEKILAELPDEDPVIIATGGMAELITNESRYIKKIHSTLSLEGLRLLYEMNT